MDSLGAVVLAFTLLASVAHTASLNSPHLSLRDVATVTVQLTSTIFAESPTTSTNVALEFSSTTPSTSIATPESTPAFLSEPDPGFPAFAFNPSVSTPVTTFSWGAPMSVVVSFSTPTLSSLFPPSGIPTAIPPVSSAVVGTGPAPSGATCEGEAQACQGDVTFYTAGLGACVIVSTDADSIIALPYAFMGDQSNENPYCGRSLTIMNPSNGKSAQATVEDKCMGCDGYPLDLTPTLFQAVTGDLALGRVQGVEWWFN